jgi:catechol 2,3-dioxygenase-like lactoylglutathione lyase family enzyme
MTVDTKGSGMEFKRIDHTALHVSDLEKSKAFYENHFGFETYFEHDTPMGFSIAYLRLGDTILELTGQPDSSIIGFHFALETDDFDGAVAVLKQAGVGVHSEPHNTTAREPREAHWRRAVFEGPDGEQIEIRG